MKKISLPIIFFAVAAFFYFQTVPQYERYNSELREVSNSFSAKFHDEIPTPSYQEGFYTAYFVTGVGVGLILALAIKALKPKKVTA